MQVWPVILDAVPAYLGRSGTHASLLQTPFGVSTLGRHLLDAISDITADPPTIVAPADAPAGYGVAIRAICPSAAVATSPAALNELLSHAEPSDVLLFVDASSLPEDLTQLAALFGEFHDREQMARHLVAHAVDLAGTRESVTVDHDGRVRSVQRYYKPATWPFIADVAASVVPVSSHLLPLAALPGSLVELRQLLVARGVPSGDVVMRAGAFDLTSEQGLLAAAEHGVGRYAESQLDGGAVMLVGEGHAIHPSARLLGPIIVQDGARVGAGATVIGPALLGAAASVGADAIVAHAVLAPGSVVTDGAVVRDRFWSSTSLEAVDPAASAGVPSFSERLARQSFDAPTGAADVAPDQAPSRIYTLLKRAADATIAALTLVVLSPLLGLIAALVRLDSNGPAIFLHPREGVDGRLFNCLKFRTMRVGASGQQRHLKEQSAIDGPHFKIDADPRITTVGRLLRATNVDELPQLVNVLVGDMSLVGPRPSPFRENQVCVPWRNGRLSVRPGITGLWQVCRHDRDRGDFHQWIEYDLLYVQHLGWWLDLKILAATVFTLGGKYPVPVSWLVTPSAPGVQPTRRDVAAAPVRASRTSLAQAERPARSAQ